MFNFIKTNLKKIYTSCTQKLQTIFARTTIDQETIAEVEKLLITADIGVPTTKKIIKNLETAYATNNLQDGNAIKQLLQKELLALLPTTTIPSAQIILLVGINGCGKTTFAGKLAYQLTQQNKRCLLVAGDTFRAAAPEQLASWAKQSQAQIFMDEKQQDPAALIFDACNKYKQEQFDCLIIDTAGRLQTKENLMKELEKIKRTIAKQLPQASLCTLLTIDAMLGQNSLAQATIFHESVKLDGIVLTKLDGTAKGGIIFSITQALNIPIAYICYGEAISDMAIFDPKAYVSHLLGDQAYQSNKQKSC